MRWLSARLFVALAAAILIPLTLACGSGNGGDDGPASPTPEPTVPPDATAIRNVDFATLPAVQTLIRQLGGGELEKPAIEFADLTGDQREEAIVPVSSGGTLGNVAYTVMTMRSGSPQSILTVTRDRNSVGGLVLAVEDGTLVKYVGKYGPEDPLCCPRLLVRTEYRWDGSALQVAGEQEIPSGSGPKQ
jgi:hypothetical protein